MKDMKMIDLSLIINGEGKILLLFKRGRWILPGGHREHWETLWESIIRENSEEWLGKGRGEIFISQLLFQHGESGENPRTFTVSEVLFLGDSDKVVKTFSENGFAKDEEIEGAVWFSPEELEAKRIPATDLVKRAIGQSKMIFSRDIQSVLVRIRNSIQRVYFDLEASSRQMDPESIVLLEREINSLCSNLIAIVKEKKVFACEAPKKKRILVVDDDPSILAFLTSCLNTGGYEVVSFSDPMEALRSLNDVLPKTAVVILDRIMPGIDGPELAKKIKAVKTDSKIILLSGYGKEEIKGVDMYLEKPVKPARLWEVLKELET